MPTSFSFAFRTSSISLLMGLLATPLLSAELDRTEFFESRIRPVLIEHCYECHNSQRAEGELSLDYRDGVLRGGTRGPLIDRAAPSSSLLLRVLRHEVDDLKMPEGGPQLDSSTIADFEKWIGEGAVDPRDDPPSAEQLEPLQLRETIFRERRKWWSFQPLRQSPPPSLPDALARKIGTGITNSIDPFVFARMHAEGLAPSEPADPRWLLRRLAFVLTGLPPTREQLDRFLHDPSPHAFERQVDEYLQSPEYGERWARHWMDWIRYAESHGSEGDPAIPYAYEYRDYLIRALQQDIPYDQLVREHLAGDLLSEPRMDRISEINESMIGASHLRMVFHGFSPTDALDEKVRFVDDQINVVSRAFLGLTVSCARCHDHKFDAITQADYYAMYGVFASCHPGVQDANGPERQRAHHDRLRQIKQEIGLELGTYWSAHTPETIERLIPLAADAKSRLEQAENDQQRLQAWPGIFSNIQAAAEPIPASARTAIESLIRLAKKPEDHGQSESADAGSMIELPIDQWFSTGNGTADTTSPAGSMAVADSGDSIIGQILPAGRYSHLLSTRHRGVLFSEPIDLRGAYDLWVHATGDGNASIRYSVHDYPRNGTIYPVNNLDPIRWQWFRYPLEYWDGDRIHIEVATAGDAPVLAKNEPRSWIGVRRAYLVPKAMAHSTALAHSMLAEAEALIPLAESLQAAAPRTNAELRLAFLRAIDVALQAWRDGKSTNEQALWLNELLRRKILVNDLQQVESLQGSVAEYRKLESDIWIPRRIPALIETKGEDHPLLIRGNHRKPDAIVPRRFLESLDPRPLASPDSGRLELAERFAAPDNPLVARVIINRLWHHVFGRGIVSTCDNFGKLGDRPTHPELLDNLAKELIDDGWSLKRAIRRMVLSRAWQLDSRASEEATRLDPENRFLSHANLRRLEAEAIRDQLLVATGQLDRTPFGPSSESNSSRRSVYLRVVRNSLDPFLRAFDFPEPSSPAGRRDVTNVPAQSLMMMNDPNVARHARALAIQLLEERDSNSSPELIVRLMEQLLGREPTDGERRRIEAYQRDLAEALIVQQRQRESLVSTLHELEHSLGNLTREARNRASTNRVPQPPSREKIEPIHHWEFDSLRDSIGGIEGKIVGKAHLVDGRLVLDGGYVIAVPTGKVLRQKTLEAWVRIDGLEQRGGGILSIQSPNGEVFDSIVYGEAESHRWMAGSDLFRRTKSFQGTSENQLEQFVHLAICYDSDGRIRGYRDGQPYGTAYQADSVIEFGPDSVITIGLRHLPEGGNRLFRGQIERAMVYDRALSEDEVRSSLESFPRELSTTEWYAALSPDEQLEFEQIRSKRESVQRQIEALGSAPVDPIERYLWTETVRALLASKEFLFLR